MTTEELRAMVINHQDRIAALTTWAESVDRRIAQLEESRDTLTKVQITLTQIESVTERTSEKITEMKKTLDRIDDDNKARHEELSRRVRALEDAPGKKWDKAVWLVITALIGAAIGLLLNLPK